MDSDRDESVENSYDYDPTPELGPAREPNAYWRRRFFILGGGAAVLGLCAWLFPGGHPAPARTSATAQASMAAVDRRGELPQAAYGSSWPSPTPKQTASASPIASPSATGAGLRKAASRTYPHASPSASPTSSGSGSSAKGPRCAPSDIVLSLFTGQSSYGQDALPTFDVYAVSTSSAGCTLNYGPGSVQLVVTRHGRVVWDSSACKPPAAATVRFTLGVPQVLSITWNRRATGPAGCAGTLPAGSSGTFQAVALTDGQSSPVRSFTLSG
jgi:hypothetical protein